MSQPQEPGRRNPKAVDGFLDAAKRSYQLMANSKRTVSVGWTSSSVRQVDLLELAKQQQKLEQAVQKTNSSSRSGDRAAAIATAEHTAAYLKDFVEKALGWNPLASLPTEKSAEKAQEVFDVPELMEMILSYLGPKDLLDATLVNKTFASALSASKKLQEIMCLRPKPQSHWYTPFATEDEQYSRCSDSQRILKGVSVNIITDPLWTLTIEGSEVEFVAKLPLGTKWVRQHIGPRCLQMLICQPPATEVWVEPQCCRHSNYISTTSGLPPSESEPRLRSSTGVTVGDLLEAAERVEEKHRLCPYAPPHQHDPETGEVDVRVTFRGTVRVAEVPTEAEGEVHEGWGDDDVDVVQVDELPPGRTRWQVPDDYISAKREAHMLGRRVPTLQQWEQRDEDIACDPLAE